MDDRYKRLAAIAASQGGFWLRADARGAGFSDTSVSEHVRTGRWSVWFDHVLGPAGMPVTWEQRLRAGFLRIGADAVVSGRSAARLWRLADLDGTDALEYLVPRDHTPTIPGLTIHRVTELADDDVTGFTIVPRVASVLRTVRCLARDRTVPDPVLTRAAASGYRLGRVSPGDIMRAVLANPGTPGNPRLTQLVRRLDTRMAHAREVSETDAIETLVAIGVERFRVNVRRTLDCGRRVEFDLLLDADDVHDEAVLEVDGARYHGDVLAQAHDAERRRAIRASGYPVAVIPAARARDREYVAGVVGDLRARARRPAPLGDAGTG